MKSQHEARHGHHSQHHNQLQKPPSAKKQRSMKACDRCRIKKVKCCGNAPCARCRQDDRICDYGIRRESDSRIVSAAHVNQLQMHNELLIRALRRVWETYVKPTLGDDNVPVPSVHELVRNSGVLADGAQLRNVLDQKSSDISIDHHLHNLEPTSDDASPTITRTTMATTLAQPAAQSHQHSTTQPIITSLAPVLDSVSRNAIRRSDKSVAEILAEHSKQTQPTWTEEDMCLTSSPTTESTGEAGLGQQDLDIRTGSVTALSPSSTTTTNTTISFGSEEFSFPYFEGDDVSSHLRTSGIHRANKPEQKLKLPSPAYASQPIFVEMTPSFQTGPSVNVTTAAAAAGAMNAMYTDDMWMHIPLDTYAYDTRDWPAPMDSFMA